jgi:hypothetical protein
MGIVHGIIFVGAGGHLTVFNGVEDFPPPE